MNLLNCVKNIERLNSYLLENKLIKFTHEKPNSKRFKYSQIFQQTRVDI